MTRSVCNFALLYNILTYLIENNRTQKLLFHTGIWRLSCHTLDPVGGSLSTPSTQVQSTYFIITELRQRYSNLYMSLNVSSCGRCLNGKSNTTKFTLFSSAQRIAFDVNRLESTPPSRPVEAWEGISTLPRTVLRQIWLFNKLSRKLTLQWISQLLKSKKARSLSYLKLYEGSIRDMQSPRYRGISTTKKGIP